MVLNQYSVASDMTQKYCKERTVAVYYGYLRKFGFIQQWLKNETYCVKFNSVQNLLTGKVGKPVLCVLSVAHILTRVFFVRMTQAYYNYLVLQVAK